MKRVMLLVVSSLAAACATAEPPSHPPTGEMWGYLATRPDAPSVEILAYAPDRPSCEFIRAMAQTRSGVPIASQRAVACQLLTVLPYREGADSVYWVFGVQSPAEQFATGSNDRNACATSRAEALKILREPEGVSECEPVVVKRES